MDRIHSIWIPFRNFTWVHSSKSFRLESNSSGLKLFRGIPKSFYNHSDLIRINAKSVLYLVWWKTLKRQSDSFRFSARHKSKWILSSFQSESFLPRIISVWISSDWSGMNRINLDWFSSDFHQTIHEMLFGMILKSSKWIGFIRTEFLFENVSRCASWEEFHIRTKFDQPQLFWNLFMNHFKLFWTNLKNALNIVWCKSV